MIGKNNKNAKFNDQLDQLHKRLVFGLSMNSDQRFPRRANLFGYMDTTRVTGDERHRVLMRWFLIQSVHRVKINIAPFENKQYHTVGTTKMSLKIAAMGVAQTTHVMTRDATKNLAHNHTNGRVTRHGT